MSLSHPGLERAAHSRSVFVVQQLTVYPIARGTLINFAAMRARYDREYTTFNEAWVKDVSRDELLGDFDQWEPEVQALFKVSLIVRYVRFGWLMLSPAVRRPAKPVGDQHNTTPTILHIRQGGAPRRRGSSGPFLPPTYPV